MSMSPSRVVVDVTRTLTATLVPAGVVATVVADVVQPLLVSGADGADPIACAAPDGTSAAGATSTRAPISHATADRLRGERFGTMGSCRCLARADESVIVIQPTHFTPLSRVNILSELRRTAAAQELSRPYSTNSVRRFSASDAASSFRVSRSLSPTARDDRRAGLMPLDTR